LLYHFEAFLNQNLSDCSQENLLQIIKDQNKELKLHKKKLSKLEEKFIKINSDLKMLQNDKANIESFLKIIFPKDMHDKLIKCELGMYDTSELNRFWIIVESTKQNDYQKFLNQLKNENQELIKKHDSFKQDLETKTNELDKLKISSNSTNLDNIHLTNLFTEISQKFENSDKERLVLLCLLDEKEKQIEKLYSLEIENAELKAKSLLENFDNKPDKSLSTKKSKKRISFQLQIQMLIIRKDP